MRHLLLHRALVAAVSLALPLALPAHDATAQPTEAAPATYDAAAPPGAGPPASDAIDLGQAFALTLLRHPTLAAFSWEQRAADARALQAGLPPNPEFETELENFAGSGATQNFDSAETTFFLRQPIPLAGKRAKRQRVAALQADLAEYDYAAAKLDVLQRVMRDFLDVLAAQERLALAEEGAGLAEEVHAAVTARVEAGKVSAVEASRTRIELGRATVARERAARALEEARRALATNWASTTPRFARVAGDLGLPSALPAEADLRRLLARNPDLARWDVELRERRAALGLARAEAWPDVTIGGGVRLLEESDDEAFVAAVSVPLPLFDRNQGAIAAAAHGVNRAIERRREAERTIERAFATTYQELAAAYEAASTMERDIVPGAEATFRAAHEGYRAGKFALLTVLDAQRTLLEVRAERVDTVAAYHRAVADLARLVAFDPVLIPNAPTPTEPE